MARPNGVIGEKSLERQDSLINSMNFGVRCLDSNPFTPCEMLGKFCNLNLLTCKMPPRQRLGKET